MYSAVKFLLVKKVFIFIGGMVAGAVLMIVISVLIAGNNSSYNGMTMFEKEGICISPQIRN